MGTDLEAAKAGRKKKFKKPLEAPTGRYFALPHAVIDSEAWRACSPSARALLIELCRQHSGSNNGRLHLSRVWLLPRGWKSPPLVNRLRDELLRNRLIVQTRHGGLRNGPHWFALTWLPVTDWRDLHINQAEYAPGSYLLKPPPAPPKKQNGCTPHVQAKAAARTAHVREGKSPRTPHVRVEADFETSPRTPHGHNESLPLPSERSGGVDLESLDAGGPKSTKRRPPTASTGGLE